MGFFDILNTDRCAPSPSRQTGRGQPMQQAPGGRPAQGPGVGTLLGMGGLAALAGAVLPRSVLNSAALMGVGAVAYNFYQKWRNQQPSQQQPQNQPWGQQPQPLGQQPQNLPWGQQPQSQPWGQQPQSRPWEQQPQGQPRGQGAPDRSRDFGAGSGEVQFGSHQFGDDVDQGIAEPARDPAAVLMLRAMIYAARADSHIDDTERGRIEAMARQFLPGQDSAALLRELISEPIRLEALTEGVSSVEQKEDIYRLSCLVIDIDHFMERGYLDALARSLDIAPARQKELEQEVAAVTAQLDQSR